MPKHSVFITEAAEIDLNDIFDYIANDNFPAAINLCDTIEQTILKIEDFPQMGSVPKNRRLARKGYRILIIDIYLVFYVILENKIIEIRRIISGRRDYSFLF